MDTKEILRQSRETIFKVQFNVPPIPGDEHTEFFFASLGAVYTLFSVEQIGCSVRRLYNIGVRNGTVYHSKTCTITTEKLHYNKRS